VRTRRGCWPALLILPVLLCCGCGLVSFFPLIQLSFGQVPLIVLGQPATGTIDAVLRCQSNVELSSDPNNSAGFVFNTGSSTQNGSTVRVRYTDAGGHERIGQTTACTELGTATTGDSIGIVYRDADPSAILLQKDQPLYRTVATFSAIAIGLVLLAVLVLMLPWRSSAAASGVELSAMSQAAIGANNYATVRIGLKEALLLLHLRRTDDPNTDQPDLRANRGMLRDHMVLAAMLMELAASQRIEVRKEGWRAHSIVVLDPSPVGEPDLDALLRELPLGQNTRLDTFYMRHGSHHVARLIAQLRQGGYLRLHEPQTGRYAARRVRSAGPLMQWLGRLIGRVGLNTGWVVLDDDKQFAYPWHLLYTTHTDAEERVFERAQAAIASRGTSDDFTRRLLILVAALYVARNEFPRRFATAKSIYRFYPPDQRWEIVRFVRKLSEEESPSEQAICLVAAQTDERLENPPDAGG
jgi:hypothetical protein